MQQLQGGVNIIDVYWMRYMRGAYSVQAGNWQMTFRAIKLITSGGFSPLVIIGVKNC
jgi:hypothetical protein